MLAIPARRTDTSGRCDLCSAMSLFLEPVRRGCDWLMGCGPCRVRVEGPMHLAKRVRLDRRRPWSPA